MKFAWMMSLLVLSGAVTASIGATFSARDGDLYLQTPSESGSLLVNGKNISEYLSRVDELVALVAMVMQDNKDLKVTLDAVCSREAYVIFHRWKTQCCGA
jgi:hypothetical protein